MDYQEKKRKEIQGMDLFQPKKKTIKEWIFFFLSAHKQTTGIQVTYSFSHNKRMIDHEVNIN